MERFGGRNTALLCTAFTATKGRPERIEQRPYRAFICLSQAIDFPLTNRLQLRELFTNAFHKTGFIERTESIEGQVPAPQEGADGLCHR